jgi:hypothetical protein
MTHPIYSQTTLTALTITAIKTIASQIGAIPDGDKRVKQTWVSAVLDHQTKFSPAKVEAMSAHIAEVMNRAQVPLNQTLTDMNATELDTPDPFDDSYEFVMSSETAFRSEVPDVLSVIDKGDDTATLPQPTPQPPTHQRLIPLIFLFLGVMAIKIGISTLLLLIGSLMRFTGSIWQSITHTDRGTESIDYFPTVPI